MMNGWPMVSHGESQLWKPLDFTLHAVLPRKYTT